MLAVGRRVSWIDIGGAEKARRDHPRLVIKLALEVEYLSGLRGL